MDILKARNQLKNCTIYDLPLKVTFYARVSSEKDEQLNSLDNQISYYRELIMKNSSWTYIEGYIDEGLSAATTSKRENFNRMIEDGKNGAFDLIITKEISRFARNTLDSIMYTRELLNSGVAVFFQNDNINTLDEDSELRLTIMSSIAQDELRKLSSRIKFGHREAIKKNVVLGNSRIFGYKKDNKRLVIDEDEAPFIRELFELYSTDKYSMKKLEDYFYEKGIRNRNGKKLVHSTMSSIIANPKYKGYYVGHKVEIIDIFTKKQKFLDPEDWVMFKDESGEIVPAIVSEETWNKANEVLSRRSRDVKNRQNLCNHANLLTGKLFCTCCGKPYYRKSAKNRDGSTYSKWVCSGKIKNGAESCPSFTIYETDIKPILFEVFSEHGEDFQKLIDKYIEMYKSITQPQDIQNEIKNLKGKIEINNKKISKLLMYNATGQMSDVEFIDLKRQCSYEKKELEQKIETLEKELISSGDFKEKIEKLKKAMKKAQKEVANGKIDYTFVNNFIQAIYVTPKDKNTAELQIKILANETTTKYLENLRSRTGQMSKKMIESYEKGLK
jgi:DNA invertase Pin-like site-specific DNA recombinase